MSAPRLEWQAFLKKKTKVNLELLADIDMLLMVEKRIRCGIFQAIRRHAKANNKYMKIIIKISYIITSNLFRCQQLLCVGYVFKNLP